ncbi:MAG: M20 family metallopeptidase [Methanobacteriota archaeon]|nr:MAG: M20 family metallopeptidase [Euryarchaeota archaeon]
MARRSGDIESRIKQKVKKSEIEGLVKHLVSIPSHSEVPTRESEVAEYLNEFLSDEGVPSRLRKVGKNRLNVIATIKGTTGNGKSLMLNGHTDTVPPYDMDIKPFTPKVTAGRLHGRGALDMKGGLGAMAAALVAIRRAKVRLQGDLILTAVVGEEGKSEGTEDIVLKGPKADFGIVGEPTSLEVQPSHRGLEWLEVHVFGKAAHGGQAEKGVNAISMAARFINKVEEDLVPKLASRRSRHTLPPTLNLGVISGGQQPSSVADRCAIWIDRRWTPEESLDQVFQEIYDVFDSVKKERHEFRAKLKRDTRNMKSMTHVPNVVSRSSPLVKALETTVQSHTGKKAKLTSFWGWTDAALLTHFAKTPTVVFGPGGAGAHARVEYVKTNDLVTCANVYSSTALKICRTD